MTDGTAREPWQWEETEWRARVNRVRAGRRLAPAAWPDGRGFAVAISFDSDHETNELRDGGNSISRLSWGEYGARVGVPRILELLARRGVPASFYVPAVAALLHPEEQRRVVAEGHEIGLHGWIHERNSVLPEAAERDLMLRSADTIEAVCGERAVGIRTPSWDFGPGTLRTIRDMGLAYDSSLMADEDCYELLLDGEECGVAELPVEWIRDDAPYFLMDRFGSARPHLAPASHAASSSRRKMSNTSAGGLFQLTLHPHIIAARSRIWILDELLGHAAARGAWFATHRDVVAHARAAAAGPGSGEEEA